MEIQTSGVISPECLLSNVGLLLETVKNAEKGMTIKTKIFKSNRGIKPQTRMESSS